LCYTMFSVIRSTRSARSWGAQVPPCANWRAVRGAKCKAAPESVTAQNASAESRRVVNAFLVAARGGDPRDPVVAARARRGHAGYLVAQTMGTDPLYDSASAWLADSMARGGGTCHLDGELGAAWIHAGSVRVAFVFHVEAGQVHEVELIADPEVLTTVDVVRVRVKS